ncbi:porin [Lacimonas salitolerans]|uniref:Porin n=1 Tax=Lacimonas salitolerans TaxID=1323750 RepID=A0ABW4ED04_9RHOB
MKNIILATTALVATAGLAAADVSISGYGRFGAVYSDNADEFETASRLRLQFDATAETDSGIVFGVRQRFQAEENGAGTGGNGARFYMTTNGFTLAMGNIIGAVEAAPNLYLPTASAGVGLEGNGFYSVAASTSSNGGRWTAYSSGGAGAQEGVEILYSMNGFGVHLHSTDGGTPATKSMGIGANYTFSGYKVALAYEDWDNGDETLFVSGGGKVGQIDAAIAYAKTEVGGVEADKLSIKGKYDFGTGLSAYAFVASEDNDIGESFGLGASYDLGGGVSLEGGVTAAENGTSAAAADDTIVSLGAFFKF